MAVSALLAHDLVRSLGTRRVLDGVSLVAAPGHRIGLIGENGSGKTTLLRLLAGVDEPDGGTVVRPTDLGFLHQETPYDSGATIADVLDDALYEARTDLAELDRLTSELTTTPDDSPGYAELLAAYGERLDHAREHDAWGADRRAGITLDGLGLGALAHDRPLGTLSGGQRGRLLLACLLIRRPTALLLDEPTNHLDDEAAVFLEGQLRDLPGVVVIASHDRAFLDAVCTDVIDLDPAVDGPTRYGGNYTAYQAEKRAERERWRRRFEAEQEELAALRYAVAVTARQVAPGRPRRDNDKMGYGHRAGRVEQQISGRVRNAARRLDQLERDQVRKPPEPLRLRAGALTSGGGTGTLLSLRDVYVPGRLKLDRLDLSADDRLLVTGPNGAGKSTLLEVLAGTLGASGTVARRSGLRIGLLAQDTTFARPDRTVRETYGLALGHERAESVPLASLGLVAPRDIDRPVGELSVGQRRRLALALLIADPPELLLLDEPTNHLSPRLCDELEDAMGTGGGASTGGSSSVGSSSGSSSSGGSSSGSGPAVGAGAGRAGAIVVASHDRWLRSRWPGRVLVL